MSNTFSDLGLRPEIVQALEKIGYQEPTPIQEQMIPIMMTGQDVIGQAQTGTGKTAAFSLPILNNLETTGSKLPKALVLAPTRELANQVAEAFASFGETIGLRVLAIYGGSSYHRQIGALKRGVDVVVGTPGRLIDLLNQKKLNLSAIETVVLDEADEMLSMGFIDDIDTILANLPEDAGAQIALFSATMPKQIRTLANRYMDDPATVSIEKSQVTATTIAQRYYLLHHMDRVAALARIFEMENVNSALVFTKTRAGSSELASQFSQMGYLAEPLNGDLSQEARERVMRRFRKGSINVLVATDVAARGIDVDDISHVINYDLPMDLESYVHRIGRTGRAGREGIAISFVTPREQGHLRRIEKFTRQTIERGELPTTEEIIAKREEKLLTKFGVWLSRDRCKRETEMVNALIEEGHDPIKVAAIALKMARANEKNKVIPPIGKAKASDGRNGRDRGGRGQDRGGRNGRDGRGRSGDRGRGYERGGDRRNGGGRSRRGKPTKRSQETGMIRYIIEAGHNQGVKPGQIVQSVASTADIPGHAIGAIEITSGVTYVDVNEKFTPQVDNPSLRYRIHENLLPLKRSS